MVMYWTIIEKVFQISDLLVGLLTPLPEKRTIKIRCESCSIDVYYIYGAIGSLMNVQPELRHERNDSSSN